MDDSPDIPPTASTIVGDPLSGESSTPAPMPSTIQPIGWLSVPAMRYPNEYVWFILLSSLDVILTWVILNRGGSEVNPLANLVITAWGLPGAIMFKFSLMLLVIIICEVVGRLDSRTARMLAQVAVLVSAMPVIYSAGLLVLHGLHPSV